MERLTGRWTCRAQGHIYHEKHNQPAQPGVCDVDGSELYQRDDDKAEIVQDRLRVYHELTQPLVSYYQSLASADVSVKYIRIDGTQKIDAVEKEILSTLN